MAIQSPLDLLVYELRVLQAVEQSKLQMVARLEQICSSPQVSQLFDAQIPEVQRQTLRVQECLRLLNSQATSVTSHAIDCMQHDLQEFMQQNPGQQAIDMYCLGMAMKVAHYEVASYMGVVEKARQIGHTQVVALLEDNMNAARSSALRTGQLSLQVTGQIVQSSL